MLLELLLGILLCLCSAHVVGDVSSIFLLQHVLVVSIYTWYVLQNMNQSSDEVIILDKSIDLVHKTDSSFLITLVCILSLTHQFTILWSYGFSHVLSEVVCSNLCVYVRIVSHGNILSPITMKTIV